MEKTKRAPNKAVWIVCKFIADCKKHHRILTEVSLRTDLWMQFKEFVIRDQPELEFEIQNAIEFSGITVKNSLLTAGQPFYAKFNEIAYEA